MKTTIIIFSCLLSIFSYGQQSFEKIEKLKDQKLFNDAINAYEKILTKSPKSFEASFLLGECYYKLTDYQHAVEYFEKAEELGCNSIELLYLLGKSKLHLLQYAAAEQTFNKAADLEAINDKEKTLQEKCYKKAQCARLLRIHTKNQKNLKINNLSFINSAYSEYGISIYGSELYFSSMRKGEKDQTDQRTLQGYSDLYKTSLDRKDFTKTEIIKLNSPINHKKFNEATIIFTAGQSTTYFMRCFNKPTHCEILTAEKNKNGKFQSTDKINISSKDYSIGHPTISSDGNTMIFVSDMPGGFGKRDLYFTTRDGKKWSAPKNIGANINTEDDEMFPSLYNDSILIFSSDCKESFGGLDIFICINKNGIWSNPKRLSSPINTGADDFGLLFKDSIEHGYFCSNRPEGAGSDDIYSFNGYPVNILFTAIIKDKETDKTLNNAFVIIKTKGSIDTLNTDNEGKVYMEFAFKENINLLIQKDEYFSLSDEILTTSEKNLFPENINKTYFISPDKRGTTVEGSIKDNITETPIQNQKLIIMGDNGYFDQATSNEEGHYEFTNLNDQNNYTLLLAKKGYWTITKTLEIPELENHKNYSLSSGYDFDFNLVEIPENEEIVINNIYYDFNKATLRDESKAELNKIADLLKKNPNIVVEISSHTDNRGPNNYNMQLSQTRAESVVNYLNEKGSKASRLIAKGYGENLPLIKAAYSEAEHQKNRRTSFKILEIKDIDINEILNDFVSENPQKNTTIENTPQKEIIYKVQVCSSKNPLESDDYFQKLLENLPEIIVIEEKYPDGFYRYIAGTFISFNDAAKLRDKIVSFGYGDCFIGVFKNNKRIQ